MDTEIFRKAKGYLLRLLKLRPYSRMECSEKLKNRGCPSDIVGDVLSDLSAAGFIDDHIFARLWLQSRLKRYGFRRVARELEEKGIARDEIRSLWTELRQEYDEFDIVRSIALRRIRVYDGLEPDKRKRRLMDYLVRRGFSAQIINQVVKDI